MRKVGFLMLALATCSVALAQQPGQASHTNLVGSALILNSVITALVVLFNLGLLLLIELQCKADANQRFRRRAAICWTLSWAIWIPSWIVKANFPEIASTFTNIISDMNTAFLVMFALGMIYGENFGPLPYFVNWILLTFFLQSISLGFFPLIVDDDKVAAALHTKWSVGISVLAGVMVGRGVQLRYNRVLPLYAAVAYSVIQPFMYQVSESTDSKIAVPVLTFFAFGKLFWAALIGSTIAMPVESAKSILWELNLGRRPYPRLWWRILIWTAFIGSFVFFSAASILKVPLPFSFSGIKVMFLAILPLAAAVVAKWLLDVYKPHWRKPWSREDSGTLSG